MTFRFHAQMFLTKKKRDSFIPKANATCKYWHGIEISSGSNFLILRIIDPILDNFLEETLLQTYNMSVELSLCTVPLVYPIIPHEKELSSLLIDIKLVCTLHILLVVCRVYRLQYTSCLDSLATGRQAPS